MNQPTGRVPPHSDEAESAVLGCIILDPVVVLPAARGRFGIKPDDFYAPWHSFLFAVLCEMEDKHRPIDLATVGDFLRTGGGIEQAGGESYIEKLTDAVPTVAHAEYYLEIVLQKAMARRGIDEARGLIDSLFDAEEPDKVLRMAPEKFAKIIERRELEAKPGDRLDAMHARFVDAHERRKAGEDRVLYGLETPWPKMDDFTSGWQPGLIIVAARPSVGKTTMEDHLAIHLAEGGVPVARVCADMSLDFVTIRTACRKAGVSLPKLMQGYASRVDLDRIREAIELIKPLPLYYNTSDRNILSICSWARAMVLNKGCKLITVDFLQLLRQPMVGGKYTSRNDEMGEITSRLKALALELNVPVMALSQLSRFERANRDPELEDLRDSGNIEQDAAVVMMMYRDRKTPSVKVNDYSEKKCVWVDFQKQQNGPTGRIPYFNYGHYFKFEIAHDGFPEPDK